MGFTEYIFIESETGNEVMVDIAEDGKIIDIYAFSDGIPTFYRDYDTPINYKWELSKNPTFSRPSKRNFKKIFEMLVKDFYLSSGGESEEFFEPLIKAGGNYPEDL